ncbi:MAG: hypothetical protein U0903_18915 [Planctomycetales bacterium]
MSETSNPVKGIAETIIAELDHFQKHFRPYGGALSGYGQHQLLNEPCVGYVAARRADGVIEEFFICRHNTPSNYQPSKDTISYAAYLSPLGRIIAKTPGDAHHYEVLDRLGNVEGKHAYALETKDEFRPKKEDAHWDATDNRIAWIGGRVAVRSLRSLLRGLTEKEPPRAIRYSVQLPDQAVLDEAQDDIFRLPLSEYILITGAPGTGKTTVLLKRLSQKSKKEFLTTTELKGLTDQVFKDGKSWLLFTPSDLLKVYLKEAMAKEFLPASDEHVKVYRTFRLEVLRDSGFIKVGPRGFFKMAPVDQTLMKRVTGPEQLSLNQAFSLYLANAYFLLFRDSLLKFSNDIRDTLGKLTDENQKVLLTALDIMAKPHDDQGELREAQRRATTYRKLNEDLTAIVKTTRGIVDTLDSIRNISPSSIYAYCDRWRQAVPTLSTAEAETAIFPNVPPLVSKLRRELRDLIESLSLSRLFLHIARSYQEFREGKDTRTRFFASDTEKAIRDRQLSEPEQDVLLFHALEFTRQLRGDIPADSTGVPDEIRSLLPRFRLLITVDEASDFSPLELACMERFALPEGGVTVSGDVMQRVTETGLREWSDMDSICRAYKKCELNVSYRQTERLFNIARDLYKNATGSQPAFRSAYPSRPEDPPALSFKSSKDAPASHWIVDRICEIFILGNNHLPTTAVLVPTPADVEPLKAALLPLLHSNGVELEASQGGQNLGDSARVRIFPVEHIKGLEFEAAFYVGLDRMAEIHKELIDKYVYVGLSRARSLLAVTYERQFPTRLKCIEQHFESGGSWAKCLPGQESAPE